MTADAPSRLQKWTFLGAVLAGALMIVPLYFLNPVEHSFFPICVFHKLTGLDCPGCGGLRATHQLLHGQFFTALKLNPLFVVLLPVGAFFAARHALFLATGKSFSQPFKSPRWVVALAVAVIAFGVLRNFPWRSWLGN